MSRQKTVLGAVLLSAAATAGMAAWSTFPAPAQLAPPATIPSSVRPGATTPTATSPFGDLPAGASCLTIPTTGAPCRDQPAVSPNIPTNLRCTNQGSAD